MLSVVMKADWVPALSDTVFIINLPNGDVLSILIFSMRAETLSKSTFDILDPCFSKAIISPVFVSNLISRL